MIMHLIFLKIKYFMLIKTTNPFVFTGLLKITGLSVDSIKPSVPGKVIPDAPSQ